MIWVVTASGRRSTRFRRRSSSTGRYPWLIATRWFHVRGVVDHPKVCVYVNDAKEPCLGVDQLSERKQGRIGLWVDTGGGEFANLKIR
ncbi:MAG TPA: hypothetical protein PK256_00540 [Verrucomicrobiota bacterium]|nr:hypothetical protein [Verrucomicrobiota bacterium]